MGKKVDSTSQVDDGWRRMRNDADPRLSLSVPPLFLPSPFSETFDRDSLRPSPKKEEVRFQVMRFPGKSRKRVERLSKSWHVTDGYKVEGNGSMNQLAVSP